MIFGYFKNDHDWSIVSFYIICHYSSVVDPLIREVHFPLDNGRYNEDADIET